MKRPIRILLAAALAVAAVSCGDATFVEKVTIVNPYEYDVHVAVGDGDSGWLNLGRVERESEQVTEQLLDMGERWVFRFRFRDGDEARIELPRSDLSSAGWRLEVPRAFTERLRARVR